MTNNHKGARRAVDRIDVGGATALYDGIARAAGLLATIDGQRIVVFLTDGADTDSRYRLSDIKAMGLYEGIFVFGLGLGQVDTISLRDLAEATGGEFLTTPSPAALRNLYDDVLARYYAHAKGKLATTGGLTVNSGPAGRDVAAARQVRARLDGVLGLRAVRRR